MLICVLAMLIEDFVHLAIVQHYEELQRMSEHYLLGAKEKVFKQIKNKTLDLSNYVIEKVDIFPY